MLAVTKRIITDLYIRELAGDQRSMLKMQRTKLLFVCEVIEENG